MFSSGDIRAYMNEAFGVSKKEKIGLWPAIFRVLDIHGIKGYGDRQSVINQIRTALENGRKKKIREQKKPSSARPVSHAENTARHEPHFPPPQPRERKDWLAEVEERHEQISASLENKGPAT